MCFLQNTISTQYSLLGSTLGCSPEQWIKLLFSGPEVRFKTLSKMKEKAMIKTAKMQGNVMVSAVGWDPR